ncbi:MAG: hypothetical protein ACYTFW_09390 [Planctomycetota bacterium]
MLQQEGIAELYREFQNMRDQNKAPCEPYIEIETNGTVPIKNEALGHIFLQLNVSPKLENSGVKKSKRYKPEVIEKLYAQYFCNFKFVVFDESDMGEIIKDFVIPFNLYNKDVYLMPGGATRQEVHRRAATVAELCKEYGFNYSPRLHIDIWNGEKGK